MDELISQLKQNEFLYLKLKSTLGENSKVLRHYNPTNETSIDFFTAFDTPKNDITSFCSLGLMHYPIGLRESGLPLRIEILGGSYSNFDNIDQLLSFACFEIMNNNFICANGSILKDCITTYYQDSKLKHILFYKLNLWNNDLSSFDFEDKKVRLLTAIPISDKEYDYCSHNDAETLIALLKKNNVDFFDYTRDSII